jgi:2-polyprenyl-6-hydroxyphenyl methylase / 3-demethylubiquinone-9 3-methyltransferase
MNPPRSRKYSDDHWLNSSDPDLAIRSCMEQQSKAYSRIKNNFIRELLGDINGKRFLDYGCGAGYFSVQAALSGASRVVGIDSVETAVHAARQLSKDYGVERICTFVNCHDLPYVFRKECFDAILIKDVIEHVSDDQALLDSAGEAVAPGGTLVVSTQNSFSLNYLIEGTYKRNIMGDKNWYGWDETHLRFYTPMSLNKKMRSAGFSCVAWRSAYIIPYKFPNVTGSKRKFMRVDALSWIDRALGGVFPYNRMGWNIIVKGIASGVIQQKLFLNNVIRSGVSLTPTAVASQSVNFE